MTLRRGPDDVGERETVPPYDKPLRGVQVRAAALRARQPAGPPGERQPALRAGVKRGYRLSAISVGQMTDRLAGSR